MNNLPEQEGFLPAAIFLLTLRVAWWGLSKGLWRLSSGAVDSDVDFDEGENGREVGDCLSRRPTTCFGGVR